MNVERGDTFIVNEQSLQGYHFTCVGRYTDHFFAGDTGGRMWKFELLPNNMMRPYKQRSGSWRRKQQVNTENIIEE